MFDLHVYGSDGTKYAAIDTVQQDPRWMMGVEITEAEMREVAKLFGMNNAADVGNLMTCLSNTSDAADCLTRAEISGTRDYLNHQ